MITDVHMLLLPCSHLMPSVQVKNGRMSVPQFGGWEHKNPGGTDYSMVFSRARANRKQQKTDLSEFKRNSLGNERELIAPHHQDDSVCMVGLHFTETQLCIIHHT
ncbi:hypothetical protein TIFTF001_043701 [Ficus carica]|uniref:RIN4 pathogenic type III effector avirulence factor Avr cleavage site domain-containing protein n=1 Tax=Ficus carica TaxID=3494 RepID=A0AA87Z1X3_FICCA|nr:hypothetical protein TIFTF001_043701 [Ficus carica]